MSRLLVTMFTVSFLCLAVVIPAWAGQTELSGKQTRGHGTNGTIKCDGVNLPAGGVILSVSDEGEGFWLEGPNGRILKFPRGVKAAGISLSAGKWYAYPYMPNSRDTADVVVTIRTPGGASGTGSSSYTPSLGSFSPKTAQISFDSGENYTYAISWNGDQFQMVYVGIQNSSKFSGRIYLQDGKRVIEYSQSHKEKNYTASYKATENSKNVFKGSYKDCLGNKGGITLTLR
ncbi:MAG: hypothetical protein AB9903_05175 [Vulcanimicrobiota bacterium]